MSSRDSAVKTSWAETQSLSNILEEEVPLHFSFQCDLCPTISPAVDETADRNAPSMLGAISTPVQIYPSSSKISPDNPEPHPISNKNAG